MRKITVDQDICKNCGGPRYRVPPTARSHSKMRCAACASEIARRYYENTRAERIAASKEYADRNKDAVRAKQKSRYYANLEKYRASARAYQRANKEARRRRENERLRNDPVYKIKKRLRVRLHSALRNKYKAGSAVTELGISIVEFMSYIESKFVPGMSWDNYGAVWHLDHIRPLSSFNLQDADQFKVACHYTNLQPLFAVDNLIKSNKYPIVE